MSQCVTLYLTQGYLQVRDMPLEDAVALVDEWRDGDSPTLTITLDDTAVTHVARAHIVRIDLEDSPA